MMKKINWVYIFKNKWYLFLIILIIIPIAWILLVKTIASPSIDHRLEILVGSNDLKYKEFNNKLNEIKDDSIYKIKLTNYNDKSQEFDTFYSAASSSQDFMILTSNFVNEQSLSNLCVNYAKIDKLYLQEQLDNSNLEYLSYNNNIYGIVIYNKNKNINYLSSYFNYQDNLQYYLFFGKYSHHIGKLNNYESTSALQILNKLFKL